MCAAAHLRRSSRKIEALLQERRFALDDEDGDGADKRHDIALDKRALEFWNSLDRLSGDLPRRRAEWNSRVADF